jgi:hypothetical protein
VSESIASRLARSAWIACVALAVSGFVLAVTGMIPHDVDEAALGLALLGCATVGALLAARIPGNAVGWILLMIALAAIVGSLIGGYANSGLPSQGGLDPAIAVISSRIDFVWIALVGIVLPLIFPTGRLPSPRWRAVLWTGVASVALLTVADALKPGPLDLSRDRIENPIGIGGAKPVLSIVTVVATVLVAACFAAVLVALARRLRAARGDERLQLKWFTYFLGLIAIGLVVAAVEAPIDHAPGWAEAIGGVGWFLMLSSLAFGLPFAAAIAIFKHRLYDIDVVINRTIVYGALTVVLALAYAGIVLLLELVLRPLTANSALAVAASTLAVAALFRPLRGRIQGLVDRRFYRHKYDAERTLEAFSVRLRDEIDLEALRVELGAVVVKTMQPAHVSLWLRGGTE